MTRKRRYDYVHNAKCATRNEQNCPDWRGTTVKKVLRKLVRAAVIDGRKKPPPDPKCHAKKGACSKCDQGRHGNCAWCPNIHERENYDNLAEHASRIAKELIP